MEPETKFPFFIKVVQSFSKEFKSQQKMRDEMTREVDGFLDESNFSGLSIFMKKGYRPNKEQILRIIDSFSLYNESEIKSTIYKAYDAYVKNDILEDIKKIESKLYPKPCKAIIKRLPMKSCLPMVIMP